MAHPKPVVPHGHGELLVRPDYAGWAALAESNAVAASAWSFEAGGLKAGELRDLARRETLDTAEVFSARLGVQVRAVSGSGLLALTGHQPELYHPGVWVKDFLLQRFADETGADAVDIVVDSDGFDLLAASFPCLTPEVRTCREVLAIGVTDSCYGCTPAPDHAEVAAFRAGGVESLGTLPTPALARHFSSFCDALESALPDARNLAEAVTFARRRFEASAGSDYLELPVSMQSAGEAFLRFFAGIALDADRFAEAYNAELAAYRAGSGVRSAAQPFPDLARAADKVELPFWTLAGGKRRTVSVSTGREVVLSAEGEVLAASAATVDGLVDALVDAGACLAPKALALTLFNRTFVSDLFVHGVGGGRYDRVTDGVVRRFYGVEPLGYAVASLTMYLPLGGQMVSDAEVEAADARVNTLEHNPDRLIDEVEFDSEAERVSAAELRREKQDLVGLIAAPDADRKALGMRIRQVNAALGALLAPVVEEARAERDRLRAQRAAADVLTDRGYPFCLWSPQEVADKVR